MEAPLDYEAVAADLVRALRGRRSCAELSRLAGYRSNIAARWEARQCWPTAARFLDIHRVLRRPRQSWLDRFYRGVPPWAREVDPCSRMAVAGFLRELKGKTPVLRIAAMTNLTRFGVSRRLNGDTEPTLPEFLKLVDVTGRKALDLVATLEDPAGLPSTRNAWTRMQLARESAYTNPWSHAVLRALEIDGCPRGKSARVAWLAQHLYLDTSEVSRALEILRALGQVHMTRRGLRPREVTAVYTGADPVRDRTLACSWARTVLERADEGVRGTFGYSLFAVSHGDLERLRNLHLEYVHAMQAIIADSVPSECIGLYCMQLIDLAAQPE